MTNPGLDRRPGIAPPPPPQKKHARFSDALAPGRFFDLRTTAFLLATAGLCLYAVDHLYFHGTGASAISDAARQARDLLRR